MYVVLMLVTLGVGSSFLSVYNTTHACALLMYQTYTHTWTTTPTT